MAKKGGRIFTAEVESVAFGGHGVARVDGMAAFVPFTVDGDVVEAETRIAKKRHLIARARKIVAPSPHRTEPRCRYFYRCGGCQYQHIGYGHQLEIKRRQVEESLKRIGGFPDAPVRPVIASPQPYSYRGKAEFHVSFVKGELCAGFFDTSGARVLDLERCEIVEESINHAYAARRNALLKAGRPRTESFVLWSESPFVADENPGKGETVLRHVKGRTFQAPASGFFQGNICLTGALVDAVLDAADCRESDSVLDLYCGSGLFSVFLAATGARVLGIEIDNAAVECALANTLAAGLDNAQFRADNVEESIRTLQPRTFSVIVLDPPRAGCDKEALLAVAALLPGKVVYISCDPATQARDLRILAERGLSLKYVQPLDMFPQTKHIETVALLEANG